MSCEYKQIPSNPNLIHHSTKQLFECRCLDLGACNICRLWGYAKPTPQGVDCFFPWFSPSSFFVLFPCFALFCHVQWFDPWSLTHFFERCFRILRRAQRQKPERRDRRDLEPYPALTGTVWASLESENHEWGISCFHKQDLQIALHLLAAFVLILWGCLFLLLSSYRQFFVREGAKWVRRLAEWIKTSWNHH